MRPSRRAALLAVLVLGLPVAARAATLEQRAYRAGLAAYVYGYPPVLNLLSADALPAQMLTSINAVPGPEARGIVLPNVDAPYTVSNLDLAAEPMVLHVPAIEDRYYVFELLDAYTNVVDYVGSRRTGTGAGDHAIVGPGFTGTLPEGLRRIDSPTDRVVLVGRTLLRGAGDLPNVRAIQESYGLQTLSSFVAGAAPSHGLILDASPPREPPVVPTGIAFFDALGDLLAAQPPPARDGRLLARLRRFGIGPGLHPSSGGIPTAVSRGLARAAAAGPATVGRLVARHERRAVRSGRGWVLNRGRIGRYGTDYALRAVTARVGLWANTPEEALYPIAAQDERGRPLDGRHRYRLRFAPGQLPPARAFWSLTMYDRDRFLYANPLDRHALGDRDGMRRDADGGLTILLQHERPGAARVANWLPAPAARFTVALRLYVPKARALRGPWTPPPVARLG